ncbi:hypothetical protein Cabys_1744 [Caldithrix abyssi DSM 13497]|uniref:Uncharacterized protein n=1 Tax=Caldithrix abyssi DSM 13497 TaxID=880073 RepID=A0A1J1C715_CALAY|nr:hypothetical protein Cabys_1744 [Caldithrix abyssi DSM 13497]
MPLLKIILNASFYHHILRLALAILLFFFHEMEPSLCLRFPPAVPACGSHLRQDSE